MAIMGRDGLRGVVAGFRQQASQEPEMFLAVRQQGELVRCVEVLEP